MTRPRPVNGLGAFPTLLCLFLLLISPLRNNPLRVQAEKVLCPLLYFQFVNTGCRPIYPLRM
jgi:hypothetical protein